VVKETLYGHENQDTGAEKQWALTAAEIRTRTAKLRAHYLTNGAVKRSLEHEFQISIEGSEQAWTPKKMKLGSDRC
jgi:uncharacterized protein YnzC (UPF0291/DUF896 family)